MEIGTKAVVFYNEGIRSANEIGKTYNLSEMTVRRFFLPPNKKTSHSKYYKGLISIKQLGGMIK